MITNIKSTNDFCCGCRLYRQTFEENGQLTCIQCSKLRYRVDELFIVFSKSKWWLISFDGRAHIHVHGKATKYSEVVDLVGDEDATALTLTYQ